MRKLLLFILILAASVRIAIAGTEFEYQGFKFYVDDTTSVALTGYVGAKPEGKLVLPSKAIYQEKEYIVDRILENAFNDCDKLTSVYFPATIADINFRCFRGCTSISEYVFDEANQSFKGQGPIVLSKDGKTLCYCSEWVKGEVIIPEGVTAIRYYAFAYCSDITKVVCSSNLSIIDEGSFFWCENLEEIQLSQKLSTIGDRAFRNCRKLKRIALPASLENIAHLAFAECSSIEELVLSEKMTTIKNSVFSNCTSLKKVVIPKTITTIENLAFLGCIKLEHIDFPSSITSIGEKAFDACYSIKSVNAYWTNPPDITYDVFSYVDTKNIKLYVPKSTLNNYKNASNIWSNFDIIER